MIEAEQSYSNFASIEQLALDIWLKFSKFDFLASLLPFFKVPMSTLVIVESPTKARTIRNYLPAGYRVEASMGHVRDLPQSASEIPATIKGEKWAQLGVNVDADFEPLYVVPKDKKKVVTQLKEALQSANELVLATDEDREGESISWHLLQLLKPKVPIKRMVFHEITQDAIRKALKNCRDIDEQVVRAQETRRILDRLVGYTLSPLLWKKIAWGLSSWTGAVSGGAIVGKSGTTTPCLPPR